MGFGLSTIFRQICKGDNCKIYIAPDFKDIKDKIYKFNNKCYKFDYQSVSCENTQLPIYNYKDNVSGEGD